MKERLRPNPWVAIPVLAGAAIGGLIGWTVASVGCRPDTCLGLALGVAISAGLLTAAGVLVVTVLAIRSLAEWRETERRAEEQRGGDETTGSDPDAT